MRTPRDGAEAVMASTPSSVAKSATAVSIDRPMSAMGLTFRNGLGLAAGIDRTGRGLLSLSATGAGHVEVGTLTEAHGIGIDRASLPAGFRVGANFASPRMGLDDEVVADYVALLRALWSQADYLVANLSAPFAGRGGDSPGVERLVERLCEAGEVLSRETGSSTPLLVKAEAGANGSPLPRAISCASACGLSGIVLVTPCAGRLRACCRRLRETPVISVGGIVTREDAAARLAAGASLVQIHTAFAADGGSAVLRLLDSEVARGRYN